MGPPDDQPVDLLGVLDPDRWRDASAGLLDGDIAWIPIRHHSPVCARLTEHVIATRRPHAVLVEGPRSFDHLIPLLVHPEASTPLAVYAHATSEVSGESVRRGAYYPLVDSSPELAALRAAAAVGATARFIDADHRFLCSRSDLPDGMSLQAEQHLAFSDALAAAARRAGCRDHHELWDHLFECADRDADDLAAGVHAYGLLARSTTPTESLEHDGTLARETVMANEVVRALADRDRVGTTRPIVVVTGAFHTAAVRELVERRAVDGRPGDVAPAVTDHGAHLIRYGFERLDALDGYAAGMVSPEWYERQYRLGPSPSEAEIDALVLEVLGDIAQRLGDRVPAGATSTPAMIAALTHTRRLASLRGRSRPARTDLVDAVTSCFVQGDVDVAGAPVLETTRRVLTGDRVGQVPPGTGRPPIALDFDGRCRSLRLPTETSAPVRVELDLHRRPDHRDKSRFLHGLGFLGVPFASWTAGPRLGLRIGTDLIREIWTCAMSPAVDVGLVEAGRWGTTIAGAVAARFDELLAGLDDRAPSAARVAMLIVEGAELGLHRHLDRAVDRLARWAALDGELSSVVSALTDLQTLSTARSFLEADRIVGLDAVITQLHVRACHLLDTLGELDDAGAEVAATSILQMRDAVTVLPRYCDPELFWATVARIDEEDRHGAPLVGGLCAGLLWGVNRRTDADLAQWVRGRLGGSADPREVDARLRGLLTAAREVVWQVPAVSDAVTALLGTWGDDEFRARLPGLRAAFSMLTPAETDRVAALVGAGSAPVVAHTSEAEVLAHLERDARIADLLRADGVTWLDIAASPTHDDGRTHGATTGGPR